MNINTAQQHVSGVQETWHAHTGAAGHARRSSNPRGEDTVSISPEALERARAMQEHAQVVQTQQEQAQETQAAEKNASANDTGGWSIAMDLPTSQIYTKLLIRKPIQAGNMQIPALAMWGPTQDEQEYFRALNTTYRDLMEEMGLGWALALPPIDWEHGRPRENTPAISPEQVKAFEEELVRRLRSDERINSLMEQFGINAQLEDTEPYVLNLAEVEKHFNFMKSISDAFDQGKITAEEVGEIYMQYAGGKITADDVELVLARYAKDEEKEPLRDLLNAGVDEYKQSQRDEEALLLLKESQLLNHMMQRIGVQA